MAVPRQRDQITSHYVSVSANIVDEHEDFMWQKRNEETEEVSPFKAVHPGRNSTMKHQSMERFCKPGMELTQNKSIDSNWNSLS